ncbi:GvpL/GvpF family gas vesicle protein [Streptomyces sp. NBC_01180]|uniref:GvpL/GvpF family gas vesicle protein n=1 Tax=Streptomyces sp. NBC_01180 TaxID=2903763 RepID=UPI00386CF54F|nr:GvpL/GvpF family gas vesicle protein [Streptomyces sp. NBC_01180]
MSTGISYVYAVSRGGTLSDVTSGAVPGLDGSVLRTVSADGLEALVSSVPDEAFGSDGMKAQMEDLKRLEEIARGHHAVVEAAYGATTVLPLRLATVYLSDERVAAMLHERRAEFAELLSWLEGHVELGVKVYADPHGPAEAQPPKASDPAAPVSPGRAYLQQRRAQRRNQQDAFRTAGDLAAEVPDRVAAVVRARVAHRPQQGELASSPGENIANDAYLVPAGRVGEFRRTLDALADGRSGVRIEITGPWAPYSFATPPAVAQGGSP